MKKIYYIQYANDPDSSLQETIEDVFDNFSLNDYNSLSVCDENQSLILDNLEEAKSWSDDDLTALMVIEYTLSENDLYTLLIGDEIESKPTGVWYYWWDEESQKLKEIPKMFI